MVSIMSIAYCGGTFDLLHPGHMRMLRWTKENFDEVVVSVNTDDFCAKYKSKPSQNLYERMEMLSACKYVDKVIINKGDEDSKPSILESKATHVVNGSDWTYERLLIQMQLTEDFLRIIHIIIILCPLERIFSTTELKSRIRRGYDY